MRRVGVFLVALSSAAAGPLRAQQVVSPRLEVSINPALWTGAAGPTALVLGSSSEPLPTPQVRGTQIGTLAAVGVLAAAASLIGGAYLGGTIENEFAPCTCEDPGLRGALLGGLVVPQVAIPLAVHLVDRGERSFLRTLGGSLIGGAAVAAVALASESLELGFFGAPVGALVGSVAVAASR